MLKHRRVAVAGVLFTTVLGCRGLERGPSDKEVIAAVRKSPPAPPTLGPTILAQVDAVEIQERGGYRREGGYWAVRVRVKGTARVKITSPFQLGLVGDRSQENAEPVDFVEEARVTRTDFEGWQASYAYDSRVSKWRLEDDGGVRHHRP